MLSSNGMLRQPLRFTTIHTWHCRERREACVLVFPFQVKKDSVRAKNFSSLLFISSNASAFSFQKGGRSGGVDRIAIKLTLTVSSISLIAVSTNGWSSSRGPHGRGCGAVPTWLPLSGHRRLPRRPVSRRVGVGGWISSSPLESWSCRVGTG